MAYTKPTELNPNHLTQETRYRFFELELVWASKALLPFTDETTAQNMIINSIIKFPYQNKELLLKTFNSYDFKNIQHHELVHYLRYKNLGVHKIRKIARISPNTLLAGGKYDEIPNLVPIFTHWDEINFVLNSWETPKEHLNLFKEDLIHTLKPKHTFIAPTSTITPVAIQTQTEITKPKSRIIEYLNTSPNTKHTYELDETTRKDMEESPHIQHAIATGTPYLLVTHYEWEEE